MKSFLKNLDQAEYIVATVAYTLVATIVFADVLLREFSEVVMIGSKRYAVYLANLATFVGMGLAVSTGSHLRPNVLDKIFPHALDSVVNRIADIIAAAFFIIAGFYAIRFVQTSYDEGFRATVTDWPLWVIQLALPYGLMSAACRHLFYAIKPAVRPTKLTTQDFSK